MRAATAQLRLAALLEHGAHALDRLGAERSMRFRSQPVRVISRIGVFAVTVALRSVFSSRPISPKKSPGPRSATCSPLARDLRLALLDGHELVGEVALPDQLSALVHGDLLGEGGDLRELLVRHVLEQRDRLQLAGIQRVLPVLLAVGATLPEQD